MSNTNSDQKKASTKDDLVDCFKCKYFYVTWDQHNPRGCKAFGFKTHQLPSVVVLETSGEKCLKFVAKHQPKPKSKNKRGWIA